jgi:glycosyl hydrolase family 2
VPGLPLLEVLLSLGLAVAPPPAPMAGALYADAPSGMYLLADRWTGRPDPRLRGERLGWFRERRDRGFSAVTVPSSFNAGRLDANGFRAGVYWYRERFRLPHDPFAHSWRLRFEGVGRRAVVFLNGRYIGAVAGQYLPSEIPARPILPGTNELVVRVDGRPRPSDLPPGNRPSGWWNYAGLLREVYLRRVAPLDLGALVVTTRRARIGARVHVTAQLRHTTRRTLRASAAPLELTAPGAAAPTIVASVHFHPVSVGPRVTARAHATFTIRHALLWSPAHPSLYAVSLGLPGGASASAHFGVRDWKLTTAGRVLLNGKPVALHGASIHEQVPGRGAALRPFDRAQLANQLVDVGADFTRSHYPLHPALLDAFDRLGVVDWEEIPVWRLRGSQMTSRVTRGALGLLRRMIERDRNHPPVMVWGAENETLRGGAREQAYLRRARLLAHRLDPSRFVGATVPLSPLGDLGPGLAETDVLGFNDYLGWYSGTVDQAVPALAAARARYPGQGAFVTEVGAEGSRPGPISRRGTYAFQSAFLKQQLTELMQVPGLNGVLVWLLRDFVVRPDWSGGDPRPHPPLTAKGLLHLDGSPKSAYATVRRAFGPRVAKSGNP